MKLLLIILFACVWLSQAALVSKPNPNNSTGSPSLKINGGTVTDISVVPWQVSIVRKNEKHDCGGCIISSTYVLSAAGCWSRPKVLPAFVRVGSTSLRKKNTVFSGFQTDVVSATTHPFYTRFIKNDFDVALVLVKTPFKFGKTIAAIPLVSSGEIVPDLTMCTMSGWGFNAAGGPLSQDLLSVQLPTINTALCLQDNGGRDQVTTRMFCAGYKDGSKAACQFDTGGPLVCNKKLAGIFSWSDGCDQPDSYGVYTKVSHSHIRDWIKLITGT